jgi:ABC-type nitrate/sulfonate/bicarbonate transport system permease component
MIAEGPLGLSARTAESAPAARRADRASLERALSVASPLALVALWEISARLHIIDTRFFPSPASVFGAMGQMLQSGDLWTDLSTSLRRIGIGFVMGVVPAVLLGILMGLSPIVRALMKPLVDATFPIPKVALVPLFILIFGIGDESKYASIAIAVFYLVLINTVAGVRNIDLIYFDVGKNFRANRLMMFTDIAFPGALPMIMAGLRLGMGVAFIVIFTAELIGVKNGIGYLIWVSYQTFQIEKMYVGLVVIALAGVAATALLELIERLLVPWKRP